MSEPPVQLALFTGPPAARKPPAAATLRRLAARMMAEAIRRHDPQIAAWAVVLQEAVDNATRAH